MLGLAVVSLILAMVAGALGFSLAAGTAATLARTLFFAFLILHMVSAIWHLVRRRPPL